jgi:hypothetical protein
MGYGLMTMTAAKNSPITLAEAIPYFAHADMALDFIARLRCRLAELTDYRADPTPASGALLAPSWRFDSLATPSVLLSSQPRPS